MRLINVHTLELEDFTGREVPPYCILSHRWGKEEVSYKEFRKGSKKTGAGYQKIVGFCEFVKRRQNRPSLNDIVNGSYDSLQYKSTDWVWVDTCCIDKRSSSELSEAINSMYAWYQNATECCVYLADIGGSYMPWYRTSEWFTRGWTLQELLAPRVVVFCSVEWTCVGHIHQYHQYPMPQELPYYNPWTWKNYGQFMLERISTITGIPKVYLDGSRRTNKASIAQRMSWAAHRQTTRPEDEAYCLLGIFGINMPLLYGEGRKAFVRLQEEIMRRSTDQSILAWDDKYLTYPHAVLAESPSWFSKPDDRLERCHILRQPYTITNNGLEMRTKLATCTAPWGSHELILLTLNYSRTGDEQVSILLIKVDEPNIFERDFISDSNLRECSWEVGQDQLIYLRTGPEIVDDDKLLRIANDVVGQGWL